MVTTIIDLYLIHKNKNSISSNIINSDSDLIPSSFEDSNPEYLYDDNEQKVTLELFSYTNLHDIWLKNLNVRN